MGLLAIHRDAKTTLLRADNGNGAQLKNCIHTHRNSSLSLFMLFVNLDAEIQQTRLAVLEDAPLQVTLALGELDEAAHAVLARACIVGVELAVQILPA